MTSARDFSTWNPVFHVAVLSGNIPAGELRNRTLKFEYTDRESDFDHIQWDLDNRDGMLTRPEHLAVSMMVQIKLGYIDGTFPWKSFILNRMRGGVGVYGIESPAVGENESRLTLYGRNRNAPGGRPSRPWKRANARPPGGWQSTSGKKKKSRARIYPATPDITGTETLLASSTKPRTIKAPTTATAVLRIAERNGFRGSFAVIEDTQDSIESITIPRGVSDGAFLTGLAKNFHYEYRISDGVFHWHSQNWSGAKHDTVADLVYGDGRDINRLDIDTDFRLPLPSKISAKGYDIVTRAVYTRSAELDEASKKANISVQYFEELVKRHPEVKQLLMREESLHIGGSGSFKKSGKAVQQQFLARYLRAIQLVAECVGNPVLLAGKMVRVGGTYSPLVDRLWKITEARHTYAPNEVYKTIIRLKLPPKEKKKAKGKITAKYIRNPEIDAAKKKADIGTYYTDTTQVDEKSFFSSQAKAQLR